ncbi:MAG: hypothetical protein AAF714_02945 [Pseudomonadota bacterium]
MLHRADQERSDDPEKLDTTHRTWVVAWWESIALPFWIGLGSQCAL